MCRGNNKNQVFRSNEDYLKYLELIARYKEKHPFDLYHYCLMTNHLHFLAMIKNGKDFSNFMKKLSLSYFKYYQKNYGWVGHFWQDRFKSKLITQDSYLIQCGKYIELNPVRAGLTEKPENYLWSSYNYYSAGNKNKLLTKDIFYDSLGQTKEDKRTAYSKMVVSEVFEFDNKSVAQGSRNEVFNANKRYKYHREYKDVPYRES